MTPLILFSFIILILSVILHEVAHGYTANFFGDPTARLAGRLTLNPLPHIDPMGSIVIPALLVFTHSPIYFGWARPVPYNPHNLHGRYAEAAVALAGVATNLAVAIIFGLVVRFGAGLPEAAVTLCFLISFTNLFLGLFNLIPFPPLDGFTALRALLPWHLASRLADFEVRLRSQGMVSLVLFLIVFSYVLSGPFFKLVTTLSTLITSV